MGGNTRGRRLEVGKWSRAQAAAGPWPTASAPRCTTSRSSTSRRWRPRCAASCSVATRSPRSDTNPARTSCSASPAKTGRRCAAGTVDGDASWHLFAGDESILPAACAMAESLSDPARATIVISVDSAADDVLGVVLPGLRYVHRDGASAADPARLVGALAGVELGDGEGHAYLAGELRVVTAIRVSLLDRGLDASRIAAKSYWRAGVGQRQLRRTRTRLTLASRRPRRVRSTARAPSRTPPARHRRWVRRPPSAPSSVPRPAGR